MKQRAPEQVVLAEFSEEAALIAAATRAWADYVACKARGGGDEMNLRPDGAGGHLHPASLSADRVNPWRLTSASYSPRTPTECEDPAPGGAGGDGKDRYVRSEKP